MCMACNINNILLIFCDFHQMEITGGNFLFYIYIEFQTSH